ncbi:unnamed protein product, partial [Effrenium voratum]
PSVFGSLRLPHAMNFPVPWRVLLPSDALPIFSGADGLREICDMTGAGCELSGENDAPSTLSDKILTISGNVEHKEAACRRIVDKLRVVQNVVDQEPGVFVIIVPSTAAPAVIGSKGAQIKEVIELSGAEVSVAKESILGMNDQPIGITGTGGQVVSAVSKINAILQDLADRGRLQPTDFRYRPGAVREENTSFGGPRPAPTGGNPRTNAKFVVATQVAGWIIGKQGRHIRELQDNSGAHIQVLKEGEVPPGVPPSDRIVEIGGRHEAKAEGIQIILMAVDSMPAMSAPRETLMLIPRQLTSEAEVKDVRQMSGCEVEVRDLPAHDEGLCTLLGSLEARVKAAQQFLKRLEEVVGDGSFVAEKAPTAAAPARSFPEKPGEDPWAKPAPSAQDDPWSRADPWTKGPASKAEPRVTFDSRPQVTNIQASYARDEPSYGSKTDSAGTGAMSFAPSGGTQMSFGPSGGSPEKPSTMSFGPGAGSNGSNGSNGSMSFAPEGSKMSFGPSDPGKMSFSPSEPPGKMSFGPNDPPGRSFGASDTGGKMSFSPSEPGKMSFGPSDPPGGKMSFSPSEPSGGKMSFGPSDPPGGKMSFSPNEPPAGMSFSPSEPGKTSFSPEPSGKMSFGPSDPPGGKMSFSPSEPSASGKMSFGPKDPPAGGRPGQSFGPGVGFDGSVPMGLGCGMGGLGLGMPSLDSFGGMGNEFMFRAALQSGMIAGSQSQLHLLLPSSLLHQTLIPKGHLAEIAQKCQVHLELGQEVSSLQQVTLRGGIAANAVAAYFLQERALQHNVGA